MRFGLHILSVLLTVALFVSGCAHNIIDVPAPSGANASDYSWKTSVASVSYTSEQKNVKTPVEIDFVQTNNTGGYDLVEHTNGIITDTLHLVSSANVLSVSGLSGRSVIGIPSGYVMTKTKFDTIASFPNITKVFAFGSTNVVATDTKGRFFFSTDQGVSWATSKFQLPSGTSESIEAFAFGSYAGKHTVAAASSYGRIYLSDDGGNTWFAGPSAGSGEYISALTADGDYIYAALSNTSNRTVSIYRLTTNGLSLFRSLPSVSTSATSLVVFSLLPNSNTRYLALGTAGNGLWYCGINSDSSWRQFLNSGGPDSAENVSFILHDSLNVMLVYTSTKGMLEYRGFDSTWSRPYIPTGKLISGVFDNLNDRFILFAEDRTIYELLSSSSQPQTLPRVVGGTTALTSITVSGGTLIAATYDSGLYALALQSQSWLSRSNGIPKNIQQSKSLIPLDFILLNPGSAGISVGNSWDAGTIVTDSTEHHLKATVSNYFEKLALDSTLSFANLYNVTYTISDSIDPNAPVWTIYYAKDEGPVLITQTQGGALISRTYRSK